MPNAAVFDTLKAAETMAEARIAELHAKAVAGFVRDGRAGLATKADVRRLEDKVGEYATKTAAADLRAEIASLETRLTVRMDGGLIAPGTAIGALVAVAIVKFLSVGAPLGRGKGGLSEGVHNLLASPPACVVPSHDDFGRQRRVVTLAQLARGDYCAAQQAPRFFRPPGIPNAIGVGDSSNRVPPHSGGVVGVDLLPIRVARHACLHPSAFPVE